MEAVGAPVPGDFLTAWLAKMFGYCKAGLIAPAFGTVFFGLFAYVGDYRIALLYSGGLFLPGAAIALLLPELPRRPG